jgi:hypothetical protein
VSPNNAVIIAGLITLFGTVITITAATWATHQQTKTTAAATLIDDIMADRDYLKAEVKRLADAVINCRDSEESLLARIKALEIKP